MASAVKEGNSSLDARFSALEALVRSLAGEKHRECCEDPREVVDLLSDQVVVAEDVGSSSGDSWADALGCGQPEGLVGARAGSSLLVKEAFIDKKKREKREERERKAVAVPLAKSSGVVEETRSESSDDGVPVSEGRLAAGSVRGVPVMSGDFYRDVVRASRVQEFRRRVTYMVQYRLPKSADLDFTLVTYARGCVPLGFVAGRERHRVLSLVGDAALGAALVAAMAKQGCSVGEIDEARKVYQCESNMAASFQNVGFGKVLVAPGGIDPSKSKMAPDMVEAIAGVLALYCVPGAVHNYMVWLGLAPAEVHIAPGSLVANYPQGLNVK